jgi:uncharacterized repeat protein (TIGR01451 family)
MQALWKLDAIYAAALAGAACLGSLVAFAAPAHAQTGEASKVVLTSAAMIERVETGADGKEVTTLKEPKDVIITPGDRVVFTLTYQNNGTLPATAFKATNPMPGPIQFVSVAEDWAEVSVDGGKNWGKLAQLTVAAKSPDGAADINRVASVEDVTHVRWVFPQPIAPGSKGSLTYRGVVK